MGSLWQHLDHDQDLLTTSLLLEWEGVFPYGLADLFVRRPDRGSALIKDKMLREEKTAGDEISTTFPAVFVKLLSIYPMHLQC